MKFKRLRCSLPYYASMLIVGVGMALVGLLSYIMFYNFKPLTINSVNSITKEVRVGERYVYEVDFCKHRPELAKINRRIVDGHVVHYPEIIVSNPIGCRVVQLSVEIPEYLSEGEYYFESIAEYKIYHFRTVVVRYKSDTFKVTK